MLQLQVSLNSYGMIKIAKSDGQMVKKLEAVEGWSKSNG